MEINKYNEEFNELFEKTNPQIKEDREKMGKFLLKMVDKDNLLYIGEGHIYGHPYSRIPVSFDGNHEYIIIKPQKVQILNNDGNIEYINPPERKYKIYKELYNNRFERFIEWGSMSDELDFYIN